MNSPRHILIAAAACVTLGACGVRAEFIFDAEVPLEPRTEQAIDRAQDWLAHSQQPNGSWGTCNGHNGLAVMALMVNGSTPGHGKHGSRIARGVEFLIASQHDNGYMVVGDTGNMYQHAIATLALAEAYGMTHNPAIRESLTKAVQLILSAQAPSGGWRYQPVPQDADLSVTVMQVMALRAASDAGIFVPPDAIEYAVKYVKKLWIPSEMSYGYSSPNNGNVNRAAAGTVCLQSCGLTEDPNVPKAVQYLMSHLTYGANSSPMFWYGHYYASVALYHYGGDAWKNYYAQITDRVLRDWAGPGHYGDSLVTSWAILVLGVPYRYLPIYQR